MIGYSYRHFLLYSRLQNLCNLKKKDEIKTYKLPKIIKIELIVRKLDAMSFFKKIAIGFVKFYQYCIRPLLPNACRFTPSCSQYSIEAINKYGAFKGSWIGLKRISRCHPWGGQGYDPVK